MPAEAWTAGPWFVCGEPPINQHWFPGRTIGSEAEGTRICDLTPLRSDEENKANARLIAAAPTLYEALSALRNAVAAMYPKYGRDVEDAMVLVNGALALARRESQP